jgi:hypothetical protein
VCCNRGDSSFCPAGYTCGTTSTDSCVAKATNPYAGKWSHFRVTFSGAEVDDIGGPPPAGPGGYTVSTAGAFAFMAQDDWTVRGAISAYGAVTATLTRLSASSTCPSGSIAVTGTCTTGSLCSGAPTTPAQACYPTEFVMSR